jgi:hypothetical protein
LLGAPGLLAAAALAAAAAAASHAWWVIQIARARKRPDLDWALRFVLTATAFVVPAVVLGLALAGPLSGPRAALAYAVVVLGGWISLTIAGMMLKIVPFLVWYRAYGGRAGRERVPTLAQLASPRLEGAAYVLLVGGVALLAIAVFAGDAAWIRGAGAILALGALAFTAALARILRHLTRSDRPARAAEIPTPADGQGRGSRDAAPVGLARLPQQIEPSAPWTETRRRGILMSEAVSQPGPQWSSGGRMDRSC